MNITSEIIITSFFAENKPKIRNASENFLDSSHHEPIFPHHSIHIEGIYLLPKQTKNCTPSRLYITEQRNLGLLCEIPKSIPVVCFTDNYPEIDLKNYPENILFLDVDMDFPDAFNAMWNCYHEYIEWGKKLDFAVFRDASFQELLDIAEQKLDAMILIYDPTLKLLAYTKKYENINDTFFQKIRKNGYMELETFQYFESQHAFVELNTGRFFSSNHHGDNRHDDKICSIRVDQQLVVYCALLYTNKMLPKFNTDALYQILCDAIYEILKKQSSTLKRDRSVTDYFLMDLLDNPDTPAEHIKERIYYNDLDFEGDYIVITIHSDIAMNSSEKYFIQMMLNNISNIRVFPYKNNIVILYKLPKSVRGNYKKHLLQVMHPVIKGSTHNNLRIYISRPFDSISMFAAAYSQAESIPVINEKYHHDISLSSVTSDTLTFTDDKIHSGYGYYFYEDFSLSDFICKIDAANNNALFCFCPPFLLELWNTNTKKNQLIVRILYEYLKNDRKLTAVADKLGMHRNNVLYHIQQISEKYHIDFDDYETRLNLSLSFELLKKHG